MSPSASIRRPRSASPPRRTTSGRDVQLVVAVTALALGIACSGVILTSDHEHTFKRLVVPLVAIGWLMIATGLVATVRRPDTRFGWLLVSAGGAWMLVALTAANSSLLYTFGLATSSLWIGFLIHALILYPDGRLPGKAAVASVVGIYAVVTVLPWFEQLWLVPSRELVPECANNACPENLLLIRPDHLLVATTFGIQNALGLLVGLGTLSVFFSRWRSASNALRRSLAPVIGAAGLVICGMLALLVVDQIVGTSNLAATTVSLALFAAVPLAFLAGVLRDRLSEGAVGPLVVELGTAQSSRVRDALARTLRDPSLELAYYNPRSGDYVDEHGHTVALTSSPDRATTVVEHAGNRLAMLTHDPSLDDNPALVRSACAAAGIALANEQLQATLRRQLDELRASRARIVAAADNERRRLERNLHDGAQQRLVALAMSISLARTKLPGDTAGVERLLHEADGEAKAALEELRERARGIHPSILDRGLEPALNSLIGRAGRHVAFRYDVADSVPAPVAAAVYYVVAEALTNIAKYARAATVTVTVARSAGGLAVDVTDDGLGGATMSDGSGLRGLQDRVEALDGTLAIDSPVGTGTRVSIAIPYPDQ
jgi:signal transduction histidine kinase